MEAASSKFHAIIPAAGTSQRMGTNKLLLEISGLTVLQRTVSRILETPNLGSVVLVSSKDNLSLYRSQLGRFLDTECRIDYIEGGATREESVRNGIRYLKDLINVETDYILVHDAARCLLSKEDLANVCNLALNKKAVTVATKVVDTLKKVDSSLKIFESVDREEVWQLQTPQVFLAKLLVESHFSSSKESLTATCDASLVSSIHDVFIYQSKDPNFKLTLESDLVLFKKLLREL